MQILINVKNLFISPRFISFYWRTAMLAASGLLALISENITSIGIPAWTVVIVGLLLGEATKAINNKLNAKPMGFSQK